MKTQYAMLSTFLLLVQLFACVKENTNTMPVHDETMAAVPPASSYNVALAGNGFVTTLPSGSSEVITAYGLGNWTNPSSVTSVYFRLGLSGQLTVALKAKVPSGTSVIKVSVNGKPFNVTLSGDTYTTYTAGSVAITSSGYVRVSLRGVSKTGDYFADVSDIVISGTATASNVVYANDPDNYYWSRRGPSVHLGFTPPSGTNAEWFYSELNVPAGQDKLGSYFMANGFSGGYFGIQVNSSTERRILFSVWDPTTGKTSLVRKGPDVIDNTFGGEGTGGQSFLVFNWQAGTTYKFLTQARPDGAGATDFSSWIYTPESGSWRFIATWKRPNTVTYLTGLYSFLENFNDTQGYIGRKALYGNQWVRSTAGTWIEMTTARFTADATATNDQRRDYAGSLESGKFYLQNCGFFSDYVNYNTSFTRTAGGVQPAVNLNTLP